MRLLIILIILFLISFSNSATSDPIWSFSNQVQAGIYFIILGIKIIVQNEAHLEGSNDYVTTYSPAFSAQPNTALGIVNFEVSDLH